MSGTDIKPHDLEGSGRKTVREAQPDVLWMPDICRFLNRDEKVVRHMIARRTIPTRRLGRRVFALREDLEGYLRGLPVAGNG